MKMLVLAGGFGTRLQPTVPNLPKALAPIDGKPFLYYQLVNWISQGMNSFVFLLYHQADLIINFLRKEQDGLLKNCEVNWLVEPSPLDTGGAVLHAIKMLGINESFLLTNADTWLQSGIVELINANSPSIAIIHLPDCSRYGQINFDDSNHVTAFSEKVSNAGAGWINAGLYHLDPGIFESLKTSKISLEKDVFQMLAKKKILTVVPLKGGFIDIGIPADYHRFNAWFAAGSRGLL
jgi:D-glycero-alpha-D-manno-heptose 1-phosphate guanylyltransferase